MKSSELIRFQIVAGWWRHQPGQPAVGGVPTAHKQPGNATSDSHWIWNAPLIFTLIRFFYNLLYLNIKMV
jgi:hypothetical protein